MMKRFISYFLSMLIVGSLLPVSSAYAQGSEADFEPLPPRRLAFQAFMDQRVLKIDSPKMLKGNILTKLDKYSNRVVPMVKDGELMISVAFFAQEYQLGYEINDNKFSVWNDEIKMTGYSGVESILIGNESRNQVAVPFKIDDHIMMSMSLLGKTFNAAYSQRGKYIILGDSDNLQRAADEVMRSLDRIFDEDLDIFFNMQPYHTLAAITKRVTPLLALTKEQALNLVPKYAGLNPPPEGDPETGEPIVVSWSYLDPDRFTDTNSGKIYPDAHPANHKETFKSLMGNDVEVSSYVSPKGVKYYYDAITSYKKYYYINKQIADLGTLYYYTENEEYARMVRDLLLQYAKYVPDYLLSNVVTAYKYDSTGGPWMRNGKPDPAAIEQDPAKYATDNSSDDYFDTNPKVRLRPTGLLDRRNTVRYSVETSYDLLNGYYFTKDSKVYTEEDKRYIKDNVFRNTVSFQFACDFAYHLITNLINHCRDAVYVGRVIDEPSYVHFGYYYYKKVYENYSITREGIVAESPAYQFTFNASHGDPYALFAGYSDPPGYVDKLTGIHLEDVSLYKDFKKEKEFFSVGLEKYGQLIFPNGALPDIHDTDGYLLLRNPLNYTPQSSLENMDEPRNVILDSIGHVLMEDGTGNNQMQTHVHYSEDDVGHGHWDCLNILINAFGRQFLDEIGYNHTRYSRFQYTTVTHNTVVVDSKNQNGIVTLGNVDYYAPSTEGVSVISVGNKYVYKDPKLDTYKRTVMQNTMDKDAPYVLDIFEVEGGTTHDYVLNGTRSHEQVLTTDVELEKIEKEYPFRVVAGEDYVPKDSFEQIADAGYSLLSDFSKGKAAKSFVSEFKYIDPYGQGSFFTEKTEKVNELADAGITATLHNKTKPLQWLVDSNSATGILMETLPMELTFEMPGIKRINSINIRSSVHMTDYSVMVSNDGTKWDEVASSALNGNLEALNGKNSRIKFKERNVKYVKLVCNDTDGSVNATIYNVAAFYAEPDEPEMGYDRSKDVGLLVHTIIGDKKDGNGTELYVGKAMAIKRNEGYDETDIVDRKSEVLILRRQGSDGKSVFVNIFEPYLGEGKIKKITQLVDDRDQVVMKIEINDRIDIIAVNLTGEGEINVDGIIKTDARFALSSSNGKNFITGGTYLDVNNESVFAGLRKKESGKILGFTSVWDGAKKNEFIVEDNFDISNVKVGEHLKVIHEKCIGRIKELQNAATEEYGRSEMYVIKSISKNGGKIHIEVDSEVGLRKESENRTRMIFFPRLVFTGESTFEILHSYQSQ